MILHYGQSVLDIPNLPAGVAEILLEPGMISVLDVGGNPAGARMAGQFMDYFKSPASSVFYLINCYRPFAQGVQGIKDTLMGILEASGSGKPHIIANPNYGAGTTVNDVSSGMERTIDLLQETGLEAETLAIREDLWRDDILKRWPNIIPIKRYLNRFTGS